MPKEKEISLIEIAITLGRVEESMRYMRAQLENSVTKEQFGTLEKDLNKMGELLRGNHADHDTRIRVLENGQGKLSLIADWSLKIFGAAALAYWGIKAA